MTGGRVLIVEDDPGCRELYADWLGGEYTVEIVGTTRAGLNRVDWQSALR
jgi:CheY-like chemotaxis protein